LHNFCIAHICIAHICKHSLTGTQQAIVEKHQQYQSFKANHRHETHWHSRQLENTSSQGKPPYSASAGTAARTRSRSLHKRWRQRLAAIITLLHNGDQPTWSTAPRSLATLGTTHSTATVHCISITYYNFITTKLEYVS